jgi:hypothetical protein
MIANIKFCNYLYVICIKMAIARFFFLNFLHIQHKDILCTSLCMLECLIMFNLSTCIGERTVTAPCKKLGDPLCSMRSGVMLQN